MNSGQSEPQSLAPSPEQTKPETAKPDAPPATAPAPATLTSATPASATPTDPKAAQTFTDAVKLLKRREYLFALDGFRKADKQDGGHCLSCETKAYESANKAGDYKAAREEAALMLEHSDTPKGKARAHYLAGNACLYDGIFNSHQKSLEAADSEFKSALQLAPSDRNCLYIDAVTLAHLKQDGAAREQFQAFLKVAPPNDVNYLRAQRFAEHPEVARERVAPNFRFTALDGRTLTLEDFAGKVVLIDFWATWCGPCREALPNIRKISEHFQGQPFAVISISLDKDDAKWKDFVTKNQMSWIQSREGSGPVSMAQLFSVHAIPATFTIDSDGIVQDQHVGEADMEGKIKKLIARANEPNSRQNVASSQ